MDQKIHMKRILEASHDLIRFQDWTKREFPHVSKPWVRDTITKLQDMLEEEIINEMKWMQNERMSE